jgi:hypothetical protein
MEILYLWCHSRECDGCVTTMCHLTEAEALRVFIGMARVEESPLVAEHRCIVELKNSKLQ